MSRPPVFRILRKSISRQAAKNAKGRALTIEEASCAMSWLVEDLDGLEHELI